MQEDKPQLFAVLMPWGRVGSNLVVAALNGCNGVKVENEPTTGLRSRGLAANLSLKEIDEQHQQHVEAFVANASSKLKATGLKLAYRSLVDRTAYLEILHKHNFKIVAMVRENFIKCAVSQQRAIVRAENSGKDGQWSSPWGVAAHEPKPQACKLDIEQTIRVARLFESLHYEMIGRIQSVFGDEYSHVTYETLLERLEPTVQSVFEYIGLPEQDEIKVRHRKATSDDLRDDIVNYNEFAAAVEQEGLGRHLVN